MYRTVIIEYLKNESDESRNPFILFHLSLPTFDHLKARLLKRIPELEKKSYAIFYYVPKGEEKITMRISDDCTFDTFLKLSIRNIYVASNKYLANIARKNNIGVSFAEEPSFPSGKYSKPCDAPKLHAALKNYKTGVESKRNVHVQTSEINLSDQLRNQARNLSHTFNEVDNNIRLSTQLRERAVNLSRTFSEVVLQLEDIANIVEQFSSGIKENTSSSGIASTSASLLTAKMLDKSTTVSHEDIVANDSQEGSVIEQDTNSQDKQSTSGEDSNDVKVPDDIFPIQSGNLDVCECDEDWKPIERDVSNGSSVDEWTLLESNEFSNTDTLLDVPKTVPEIRIQPPSILYTDLSHSSNACMPNQKMLSTCDQPSSYEGNASKLIVPEPSVNESTFSAPVELVATDISSRDDQIHSNSSTADNEIEKENDPTIHQEIEELEKKFMEMKDEYDQLEKCGSLQGTQISDQEHENDVSAENIKATEVFPSNPTHSDHRINEALSIMVAMGFSNESNLVQLLELVDGNVEHALELMQPQLIPQA